MAWTVRATSSSTARRPDLTMVRAALAVLADPENGCEVRGMPSQRSRIAPGNDLDALCRAVEFALDERTYVGINPMRGGVERHPVVADVVKRRWLMVDVDADRPDTNVMATDGEHEAARLGAADVMEWLGARGWPAPLLIDSGNGFQLLYRIDLPNPERVKGQTDLSTLMLGKLLRVLAKEIQTPGIVIDTGVNVAIVRAKLPGTWVSKGQQTDDRPHRMARIAYAPEVPEIVPAELIRDMSGVKADEAAAQEAKRRSGFVVRVPPEQMERAQRYGRKALELECAKVSGVGKCRQTQLWNSSCSIGELVGSGCILRQEAEGALELAGMRCGLDGDEKVGIKGIRDVIKRGLNQGMTQPRLPPERPAELNGTHKTTTPPPEAMRGWTAGESIILRASEVTPRRVSWLWPGRIPLGKLTTFAGLGGLGKTFALCDIAARVSTGGEWPDLKGECCEPGQVLFVTGEDDYEDTIVPRLMECGADLTKIVFLKTAVQDRFTLKDKDTLTEAVRQIGANVRFVAIDPPTAFLGGVDDHKNAELRGLLTPLKSWAAEHALALVFNTHITKGGGQKVEAMMRVMGSVAWVNAVRAAHLFSRDPEDPDRRLFIGMKMNIARERKGLAYRILGLSETDEDRAKVEWLGEVDTTADQAINRDPGKPRRVVAKEWLVERFRERLEWPSNELFAAGKADNVHRDAIYEAKHILCLPRARQIVQPNGDRVFFWWVPPDWPPLSQGTEAGPATVRQCDSADEEPL